MRRSLSEMMRSAVVNFPDSAGFSRNVMLMASVTPRKAYVLLQLRPPEDIRTAADYRSKRQTFLGLLSPSELPRQFTTQIAFVRREN